jgi:hypothetical protein
MSSSAAMRLSASTSPWRRAQVVPCSRPGRTGETQIGQPSGVVMTCTFPPWCLCFPVRGGEAVGADDRTVEVQMRQPGCLRTLQRSREVRCPGGRFAAGEDFGGGRLVQVIDSCGDGS